MHRAGQRCFELCCAIQFRISISLKIFPILFIVIYMHFINFHSYFNNFISFRQEYFSFRLYFSLIANIKGIIYFAITFPPLIIPQNKIYYKTINFVISVIPDMIRNTVSLHSPESYCSLRGFAAQPHCSLRQFDGECTANP